MIPMIIQLLLLGGVIGAVRSVLGQSGSILALTPAQAGGAAYLMPVAAGCAALLLGVSQNHLNPLQREQARAEQLVTNGISVGISLALGVFVPLGVGIYWIAGNLTSILQQILLNTIIKPRKYIDYAALEHSRKELSDMDSLSPKASKAERKRERQTIKNFSLSRTSILFFIQKKADFINTFKMRSSIS